jgi:hypothetical protein
MRTLESILVLIALTVSSVVVPTADAQVTLPTVPSWTSVESAFNGTGLDIGDVDGDGWLDLAVSNGNDITASPNFVYLNQAGDLPPSASWVSDDARYSGHCQLGDVDGDGYPEFLVANYISAGWGPAQIQLYDNVDGDLTTLPIWESPANFHSFRATFGDPDGDGDLDVAVATGEAYNSDFEANLVFFNVGGTLEAAPGWQTSYADASYDAKFVDIDGDGDQDLAFCGGGANGRVRIHRNVDGVIETSAFWTTATGDNGNTFDFDDLDGDGRLDLLVGFNDQLAGSGRFAVFLTAGGDLPTTPSWTSEFSGYGSAVVCADIDGQSGPDLVTGGWWEPIRIYLNDGSGGFTGSPQWQTAIGWASVVENIALADLNNGSVVEHWAEFAGGGTLHRLPHRHLQRIVSVTVDDFELGPDEYCFSLRDGWVSHATTGDQIRIGYLASPDLDVAISNWDDATYVFENLNATGAIDLSSPMVTDLRAYPNPFNPQTTISLRLGQPAAGVVLRMYDLRGRQVDRIDAGDLDAGRHDWTWRPSDLPSGLYLYRVDAGAAMATGKVMLAR